MSSVVRGRAVGRIAVISHRHPSISKGGAEIAAHALFSGLRELDLDPIFIAACDRTQWGRISLGPGEFALMTDQELYGHFYHVAPPQVSRSLRDILRFEDVGHVAFHHFIDLGLNSIWDVASDPAWTTSLTLHEFGAICAHHGQMVTRPSRTLCHESTPARCQSCFPERKLSHFQVRADEARQVFDKVGRLISPSRFLADRFEHWGVEPGKIAVIENGLKVAQPVAQPNRPEGRPWTFGFFGQVNPFKGVEVILAAAEHIARNRDLAQRIRIEIRGNVIGQSTEFERRLAGALRKHDFLSYEGPYDNSRVSELMRDCDYVVVPSTWWENSPVVIQEAYAAGAPVICSNIGGMAEKVADGITGLHFRVGDPAALARCLEAAADVDLHMRLSAALPRPPTAREMALNFLAAIEGSEEQGGVLHDIAV